MALEILNPLDRDYPRLVKAVGENEGVQAASKIVLAINRSTVFRRLALIEKALGPRLFERQRGGYQTTLAGD